MFVVTCGCGASRAIDLRSTTGAIRCPECGAALDLHRELLDRVKAVVANGEMLIEECRWLRAEASRIREESASLRRR
jgi:hypothetical protein